MRRVVLGSQIRGARRQERLSLMRLRIVLNRGASSCYFIVNGITASARMDTIKKLCDGLEISVHQFFDSPLFDDLEQELK